MVSVSSTVQLLSVPIINCNGRRFGFYSHEFCTVERTDTGKRNIYVAFIAVASVTFDEFSLFAETEYGYIRAIRGCK